MANQVKKVKGVGDVIAKVTEAVGIVPCDGCNERKEKLNKLFPLGHEELTEDEKTYLKKYFANDELILAQELLDIYFRVFRKTPFIGDTRSSGVWINASKKLKKIYDEN
jgi:hypothetical protein